MNTNDFRAFSLLIYEVNEKAFRENLSLLNFRKARALSNFIYECTGCNISYKSLIKYFNAVVNADAEIINPSDSTLSILVWFIAVPPRMGNYNEKTSSLDWYKYRNKQLKDQPAVLGVQHI